jgi:hypothetical protein
LCVQKKKEKTKKKNSMCAQHSRKLTKNKRKTQILNSEPKLTNQTKTNQNTNKYVLEKEKEQYRMKYL